MRRPRSRVGAELVPLVLILACLAGSLALIVGVHRRSVPRPTPRPPVVVAPPPPASRPIPVASVPEPEPPEPEPPAPPIPEDPTPRAVAGLTAAEAEQRREASRADRKAAALDEARRAAVADSDRWRRRQSLVHSQLSALESRARKVEADSDHLAFERDALLKERDARKAAIARVRTRPGQAILPHKGPNGTWRRPIVVECTNGMAILRPQGIGFGLLELASGFGPSSNPFVATVAREAARIGRKLSPDGAPVVPYIFFLVRPDGVRPYYEARGRLEPLGITFGYELADQDWDVEFPDLDDTETWDGSAPGPDLLAGAPTRPPGSSPAEDETFPAWGSARPSQGPRPGGDGVTDADFLWPGKQALAREAGGAGPSNPAGPAEGTGPGGRAIGGPGSAPGGPADPGGVDRTAGARGWTAVARKPGPDVPRPGQPVPDAPRGDSGRSDQVPGEPALEGPRGGPRPRIGRAGESRPANPGGQAVDDPGSEFVWPARPGVARGPEVDRPVGPGPDGTDPRTPGRPGPGEADDRPPVPHRAPFSRPLAREGLPASATGEPVSSGPGVRGDGSGNRGSGGGQPARAMIGPSAPAGGSPPGERPPQGAVGVGLGMPSTPSMGGPPGSSPTGPAGKVPAPAEPGSGRVIDRRFEVVVVCGPRGLIVQPGGYRVTVDALKDRDGLLKKQMVALVKARRAADPGVILEPRLRFLVQSGGGKTYWTARGQVLLSGLDWPMTTQVADPDPLAILPSEGW